ncbi:MAG TPA: dipeptide/oligopeptide/nickel ABC transporter ATP-binding protein [Arachnia sp.]|nr:dipeptide/oligopeptide/nickel ABC transporter ATP-binding protein [Arachnia sp.]HMT85557.1 dipeptide/oligopeptide/nickel ABC transporter ATP-binding protein [Arachnia sp.]
MSATAYAPDAALVAKGLTHRYRRLSSSPFRRPEHVHVLTGLDIRIGTGEAVGIVGRSGSGKSTMLRILLGLERPDSGEVWVGDELLRLRSGRGLRSFRRHVQYIPQEPATSLDPRMTVEQLVVSPLRRLGVPGDHRELARRALAGVQLDARFLHRYPGELSGGQAQRVAIARALATGARILLADEPVSGLDRPLRDEVLQLFGDIVREEGVGVGFVSHDLDAVRLLCGHSCVLSEGRIVETGATAELLSNPTHEATRAIVEARPRLRAGGPAPGRAE